MTSNSVSPNHEPSESPLKICVLIVTSGRTETLKRTLDSLAQCSKPKHYLETIVVENGDTPLAQSIVESFANELRTRYIYTSRRGKSHALNLGVKEIADDSLILFADNDVRFSPNWIEDYYKAANSSPQNSFFGGPTSVDYESVPESWLIPMLPDSARGMDWTEEQVASGRPAFLGFNWAAYSRDIKRVGLFDENIGPGSLITNVGDETDIQQRMRNAEMTPIYVASARVWHLVPENRCSAEWLISRSKHVGRAIGYRESAGGKVPLFSIVDRTIRLMTINFLLFGSKFQSQEKNTRNQIRRNRILGWFEGSRMAGQRHSQRTGDASPNA